MKLSQFDIQHIAAKLTQRAPDMAYEIKALAAQARGEPVVQYVEVVHSDGKKEVMPAAEYQRLTATDLAHASLRVLSAREAARLRE